MVAIRPRPSLVLGEEEAVAAEERDRGAQRPEHPDTSALLARVRDGDPAAFAGVYDATVRRVYGLVRKLVGDAALAEEVVQEVYVEVWRTAARFDASRGRADAWILMISRRRAIDRIRSEQAARAREQRDARLSAHRPATADGADAHIGTSDVRDALRCLPEPQREALVLAYFGGHTHREVALLLGAPLGTVKGRIRDGLLRLREALEVGT